jgi:hypothetical protein
MPEFDHGFKIVTHLVGQQLAEIAKVHSTAWEPITSEVQTVERLADRAFRAADGNEHFVVYFESYTYWEDNARWSLLAKSGLLSERERLPTECIVFILHPRGYQTQRGQVRLTVRGRTTQLIRIREVCLWRQKPQPWWETVPGVMTLYPLCRHRERPEKAITHAASVIEQGEADKIRRADLLSILGFFGRLAYPDLDPVQIIGRDKMKESPFFEQVMNYGRVENAQKYIIAFIEGRFGKAAAARIADAVHAIDNLPRLDALAMLAARCERAEEFFAELAPSATPRSPRASRNRR